MISVEDIYKKETGKDWFAHSYLKNAPLIPTNEYMEWLRNHVLNKKQPAIIFQRIV